MSKITKPFVRDPYNYDRDAASNEDAISCPEPSLAQQHMKEECDINYIVERFGVTGAMQMAVEGASRATYGDFTGISDYKTAVDAVHAAEAAFMSLPAQLRARFDNDPNALLNFLNNEENRSEAVELGIIDGEPVAQPIVSEETPKSSE